MAPIATTKIVILAAVIILVLYDVFVFNWGGQEATISEVLAKLSYEHPVIPFAAGFLCAHLFWRH